MAVVWCRVTRSVMSVMYYALVTWHCHGRLGPLHQIKTLRQALRHSHLTIIIKSMAGMYSEPFHFSMWYMSVNQMFISILKLVHDPRNCLLCGQHVLAMSLTGQNYNHPSSVSAMRLWASSCVQRMSTQLRSANITASHSQSHNGREFKIFLCPYFISNQYTDTKLLRFDSLKLKENVPKQGQKRGRMFNILIEISGLSGHWQVTTTRLTHEQLHINVHMIAISLHSF